MAYRRKYRARRRRQVVRAARYLRRAKRMAIGTRNRSGALVVVRKLPAIQIYQNTTAGNVTANDPTASCITFGTPEAVSGVNFTYNVPFALRFRLDQMINYTDVTNICDQYKIISALCKLHNNYNNVNTANNVLAQPWVEYTQDYDDNTPATVSAFRQKMGLRTKYFTSGKPSIGMGVRPKVTTDLNAGGSPLPAGVQRSRFINSTYSTVDHFGIKGIIHNMFLPGGGTAAGSMFDLDVSLKVVGKDIQ